MLSLRDTTAAVRHLLSVTADRVRDEAKGVVQRQNLTISQALALAALAAPRHCRLAANSVFSAANRSSPGAGWLVPGGRCQVVGVRWSVSGGSPPCTRPVFMNVSSCVFNI